MKKVTLKSLLNEYDRRMSMLCDPLIPNDDVYKEAYSSVKNIDKKELKQMYSDFKAGLYPEDWIIDSMIGKVMNNVSYYAKESLK